MGAWLEGGVGAWLEEEGTGCTDTPLLAVVDILDSHPV